ncbi:MAG: hypothetical protein KDC92_03190, partial [Bacteroidetes bacterium]|nr:hypothetical protein [Bacteroidota bacterium]
TMTLIYQNALNIYDNSQFESISANLGFTLMNRMNCNVSLNRNFYRGFELVGTNSEWLFNFRTLFNLF